MVGSLVSVGNWLGWGPGVDVAKRITFVFPAGCPLWASGATAVTPGGSAPSTPCPGPGSMVRTAPRAGVKVGRGVWVRDALLRAPPSPARNWPTEQLTLAAASRKVIMRTGHSGRPGGGP